MKQDKEEQVLLEGSGYQTEEYQAEKRQLQEKMRSMRDSSGLEDDRNQMIPQHMRVASRDAQGIQEEADSDVTAQ